MGTNRVFFSFFLRKKFLSSLKTGTKFLIAPANPGDARDTGSIPEFVSSPGGGNGNPLQYSCLKNPMDRGAWWPAVHAVAKSRKWTN